MFIHSSHRPEARLAFSAVFIVTLLTLFVTGLLMLVIPPVVPHYLPIHTSLETLSLIVSVSIFAVVWSLRHKQLSGNVILLACAFLGVALLDLTHMLSFKGMPEFITPSSPEKAIYFWLVGRLLGAITLVAIAVLSWNKKGSLKGFYFQMLLALILVLALHILYFRYGDWIPDTFSTKEGLTPFKVKFEYLLIVLNLLAAVLFIWRMRQPRHFNASALFAAACIMAQGEFFFTLYSGVTDVYNLAGHCYKVLAYAFLFRAVFVETVLFPYTEMQESQQQLKATLEALPDLVFEFDAQGRYLAIHAMHEAWLFTSADQLLRLKTQDVMSSTDNATMMAAFSEARLIGTSHGKVIQLSAKDESRWYELSVACRPASLIQEERFVVIARDITEKKSAAQRIHQLSFYDQLTGLPNHARLTEHLQYVSQSASSAALLWIDLDSFKDINDSLGYDAGDELLLEISNRLRRALRTQDFLSRLSGDYFVVVLPDTSNEDVTTLVNLLLELIAKPLQLAGQQMSITASIGIALYPSGTDQFETLLKHAESAMYRAKDTGRNRACYFIPELQAHATRLLTLSNALKLALSKGELYLVYQPQLRLHDEHFYGAEALLRWDSPELGSISPAEFIPIAESSGLIITIGEWVLRTALQQVKDWRDRGLNDLVISVNLSAVQFSLPDLPDRVSNILEQVGVAPECLILELTERVAMNEPELVAQRIYELRRRGIGLAIDDFGTGYSSLSYLKRFKIDKLKIDQSFVRDIESDPDDQAIVSSIIQMSLSLGISTIAEGVETPAQLAFLQASGCDDIQGYYISRPLSPVAFEDFILQHRSEKTIFPA